MGRSSKNRDRKTERKKHKLQVQIAQQNEGRIPSSVAVEVSLPEELSHQDGKNYQLIFEKYNHKECEIPSLDDKSAKALINKLNEITRQNSHSIAGTKLVRDKVNNAGKYASLFNDLEDDVHLREIKYRQDGRIICYFVNQHPHSNGVTSNYCCIVAILVKHRNI